MISQHMETRIMHDKTTFTEQTRRVATDLFDGHLREVGELDLVACSEFVEAETGLRVSFVTKPGTNTWFPKADSKGLLSRSSASSLLSLTTTATATTTTATTTTTSI